MTLACVAWLRPLRLGLNVALFGLASMQANALTAVVEFQATDLVGVVGSGATGEPVPGQEVCAPAPGL